MIGHESTFFSLNFLVVLQFGSVDQKYLSMVVMVSYVDGCTAGSGILLLCY